jgi:hypothetical protein
MFGQIFTFKISYFCDHLILQQIADEMEDIE